MRKRKIIQNERKEENKKLKVNDNDFVFNKNIFDFISIDIFKNIFNYLNFNSLKLVRLTNKLFRRVLDYKIKLILTINNLENHLNIDKSFLPNDVKIVEPNGGFNIFENFENTNSIKELEISVNFEFNFNSIPKSVNKLIFKNFNINDLELLPKHIKYLNIQNYIPNITKKYIDKIKNINLNLLLYFREEKYFSILEYVCIERFPIKYIEKLLIKGAKFSNPLLCLYNCDSNNLKYKNENYYIKLINLLINYGGQLKFEENFGKIYIYKLIYKNLFFF